MSRSQVHICAQNLVVSTQLASGAGATLLQVKKLYRKPQEGKKLIGTLIWSNKFDWWELLFWPEANSGVFIYIYVLQVYLYHLLLNCMRGKRSKQENVEMDSQTSASILLFNRSKPHLYIKFKINLPPALSSFCVSRKFNAIRSLNCCVHFWGHWYWVSRST